MSKIIITGHDYAGKSTVLAELWNRINTGKESYIHLSYREPTDLDFYRKTLKFHNFLMDRCFLDELIYPVIFNRPGNLTLKEAEVLMEDVALNNIEMYILECTDDEIQKRILKRTDIQEEPEVLMNILKIKELYRQFAKHFSIPIIDTTNKSVEEIISEMESYNKQKTK